MSICVYMYICIYVYMCICVYMYICIYVYMYICICFRTTSNHIHGVKLEIRKVSTHIFPCKVILKNNHECDRNLVLYTLSPCL